jgi:O-antigen/teichoic acid export membrane protein
MKNFLKDLLRVTLSKSGTILTGIATSVITARYLGPEKNGLITILLVYPTLFMSVGSLGIQQATTFFVGKKLYTDEQIKRTVTQIWLLTSIISIVVCFFLMTELSNSGDNLTYVCLALAPIPFALFNTYNSGFFLGKNNISTFNKISWIPSFVTLILTFLLLVVMSFGISGYLFALLVGPIYISVVLLFRNRFFETFSLNVDWSLLKALLSLGSIYAISLLVSNLNYRFDVIMLDKMSNAYELGIYSKGANVIQFLWQIPMLLSTIVFARSAVSKNDKAFSLKVCQLLRLSLLVIVGFSIILAFCSDFLMVFMFGKDFFDSSSVLKYLIPGILLMTVFKVLNMDLAGKGMPWISLKSMVPGLIINIICNWFLIPAYGADGAAISSTISYSCSAFLFLYFYSSAIQIPILAILGYKKEDFYIFNELLKLIKSK